MKGPKVGAKGPMCLCRRLCAIPGEAIPSLEASGPLVGPRWLCEVAFWNPNWNLNPHSNNAHLCKLRFAQAHKAAFQSHNAPFLACMWAQDSSWIWHSVWSDIGCLV